MNGQIVVEMLHEILLALVGHTGDIIIRKRYPDTRSVCGFHVAPDISFLSRSEKEATNQTCNIGFYYCLIDAFVTSNLRLGVTSLGGVSAGPDVDNEVGLYVRALSVGLAEVLAKYRASVLQLEQEILASPVNYPLSKLHYHLRDYFVILPPLSALVQQITSSKQGPGTGLHGGHLLNLIYKKSLTGIDAVRVTFKRLLFHCHKVLFNQVSSWLVHGLITDPFQEFFVQRIKGNSSGITPDAKGEDEEGEGQTVAVHALLTAHDWNSQYNLRLSMLPTAYIPVSVANKILFIGRAVCILQHPSVSGHGLLPHGEGVEFAKALHKLRETQDFDLMKVELEVNRIRAKVSRYLWELVVKKSKLQAHVKALKDFFLLGRGEFFQCFLDEAETMMSRPPGPRAARDINNGPFQNAATKLGVDESEYFKRLSFQMDQSTFNFPNFTEVDFPKSTVKSGLICLGSSQLVGESLQLTSHASSQSGAVWFSPRKVIERGFVSNFMIHIKANPHSFDDEPDFREGFAFVLQNDGMQSLPIKTYNPTNAEQIPLVAPNCTSINIEFVLQHGTNGLPRCQIACYSHTVSPQGTKTECLVSTNQAPNIFGGDEHEVTVQYTTKPEILQVLVEGQVVLTVQTDLRRVLQLEGGRAWLGFQAATGDDPRQHSHAPALMSWDFESGGIADTKSVDGWRNLRLEYAVDPPLDLVLPREGFDRYNALFRFLFDVKRVRMSLQHAWTPNMRRKLDTSQMPVLALRARMQYFVDTLCYYVQVDVVEVQFLELTKNINESQDFETVRKAHEQYLASLITHCFLRDRIIYSALSDIFETCTRFCRMIQKQEETEETVEANEVSVLSAEFQRQSTFLFTIISRKTNLHSSDHLARLVMRLDYNRYFTLSAQSYGKRAVSK